MLPDGWEPSCASAVYRWGSWGDGEILARRLFSGLRALDDAGATTIICPVDATPATPIADLLALAATLSPAVVDVQIVQPTLEDVFLQLTGRSDAAAFAVPREAKG